MNQLQGCVKLSAIILVLSVITCHLLFVTSDDPDRPLDLQSLCEGKLTSITHRSQIRTLARILESGENYSADSHLLNKDGDDSDVYKCPSRIGAALVELDQLVNDPETENICSLEHIEKIKQYIDRYLATSLRGENQKTSDETEAEAEAESRAAASKVNIPKALQDFFIGYGLKVSRLCKTLMINSLIDDGHRLLKKEEFEVMEPLTGVRSAIAELLGDPEGYDDLFLPRDLERVLGDGQATDSKASDRDGADMVKHEASSPKREKLYVHIGTPRVTKWVQALCEHRFKPIYDATILPIIYLVNLGFDYTGEDFAKELKFMKEDTEVHQWYRTVYFCESLSDIEVVEDPNSDELDPDTQVVRVLTKEEAVALMKQNEADATAQDEENGTLRLEESGRVDRDEVKGDENSAGHTGEDSAGLVESKSTSPDEGDGGGQGKNGDGEGEKSLETIYVERLSYKPEPLKFADDEIIDMNDANFIKLINSFSAHVTELDRIELRMLCKFGGIVLRAIRRGDFKLVGSLLGNKLTSHKSGSEELVEIIDNYVKDAATGETTVAGHDRYSAPIGGLSTRYYHNIRAGSVRNVGKKLNRAWDKAKIRRVVWYSIAILLFVIGITAFLSVGAVSALAGAAVVAV